MALVPFTGTVTAATLNANFNDANAAINSQAVLGQVDMGVFHKVLLLAASATPAVTDFVDFIPQDDYTIEWIRVYATDATAGQIVTASLTVANGDTTFLCDQTVSKSVTTTAGGVVQATLDLRTVTGVRVRALRGVPYRLSLATDTGTIDEARAIVGLRSLRRTS